MQTNSPIKDNLVSPLSVNKQTESMEAQRLLDAKLARKKIEEDTQLLENRIALLENEEKKALKKIEETKKKAEDISSYKLRNKEAVIAKEEKKKEENEILNQKSEFVKSFKENNKKKLHENKNMFSNRVLSEVKSVKIFKEENKKLNKELNKELISKNTNSAHLIKEKEKEITIKKKIFQDQKLKETKKEYEERINRENEIKKQKQNEISDLEKKEMELIKRLQNTQDLQKKAFLDLEKAISQTP